MTGHIHTSSVPTPLSAKEDVGKDDDEEETRKEQCLRCSGDGTCMMEDYLFHLGGTFQDSRL